ncbi:MULTISPECIES: hypothetical protein [unclassified Marinovum]|uniref:hypothetical protein n=1 Tax=unclassified Marinovum TaxID=2647166 RepID=UPI003EDC31E0
MSDRATLDTVAARKRGSGGRILRFDTLTLPVWIFSAILITALPISFELFVTLLVAMLPILIGHLLSLRLGSGRRLSSILFTTYLIIIFIRPLFLYDNIQFYKFSRSHPVDAHYVIETLWGTADLHICFAMAVLLIQVLIRPINMRRMTLSYNMNSPAIARPILLGAQSVFFVTSLVSILSPTFEGLFNYVELVLPASLIAAFGMLAIVRGTARLADWGLVGLYSASILISGSKSFFIELMFIYYIMVVFSRRYITIRSSTMFWSIPATIVLVAGFPFAMLVRRADALGINSVDDYFNAVFFLRQMIGRQYDSIGSYVFNLITQRMNGFDGLMMIHSAPTYSLDVYSWEVVLTNLVAALVPGMTSPYPSIGVANSINFYTFSDASFVIGGSIGLPGTLWLMSNDLLSYGLQVFVLIALLLLIGKLYSQIFSSLYTVVSTLVALNIVMMILGGALDRELRSFVALFFGIPVFSLLLWFSGSIWPQRRRLSIAVRTGVPPRRELTTKEKGLTK